MFLNQPAPTQPPAHAPATAPTTVHQASGYKRSERRRRIFSSVLLAVGIVSLVTGISRKRDDAYCEHPLQVWLIVHAAIVIAHALILITRGRMVAQHRPGLEPAIHLTYIVHSALFVFTIGWIILGAYWTWSISTSSCDSSTWDAATSVLCVGLTAVTLTSAYHLYKWAPRGEDSDKQQAAVQPPKQAQSPEQTVTTHPDEAVAQQPDGSQMV